MSGPMTFQVNTGNPDLDQQTLAQYQQSYAAQGMHMTAQPLPGGGFQVTVTQAGVAPAPSSPAPSAQANKGFGATMPLESVPEAQAMLAAAHAAQQNQQAQSAPPASPQGYAQQAPAAPAAAWQQQPQAPQAYAQPAAAPQASPTYGQPPAGYGQPAGGYGQPAGGYGQAPAQAPGGYAQAAGGYGQAAGAYGAAMGGAAAMAGAGAMAMGGGGFAPAAAAGQQQGGMVNQLAQAVGAPAIGAQRLQYLRKVYGLLTASAFVAVIVGYAAVSLGPTQTMRSPEGTLVQVPMLVGAMLANPTLQYIAFGALFVGTIVASWFSKVKYLNIAALMGVAALMGFEIAPMVFEAQFYAGMGATMSAAPVRDAFLMVLAVFSSMTAYVFVSRKDFSWLWSIVSIGFVVVFMGCIMAFFLDSEAFSLAIATAGALLSTVTLLYVTWYIFRKSEMDDAVGDALALLVQLRNLFMFLLRIFMSNR